MDIRKLGKIGVIGKSVSSTAVIHMDFDPTAFEDDSGDLSGLNLENEFMVSETGPDNDTDSSVRVINKSATMFVIMYSPEMFTRTTNKETQKLTSFWEESIDGIVEFMKNSIIKNENDKVSLVLYNVGQSKNVLGFKGINTVYDFDVPDAKRITDIQKLARMEHDDFLATYGAAPQGEASCSDLFWAMNQTFQLQAPKSQYRGSALIFTTNDDPSTPETKTAAIQRAVDLQSQGVSITVLPLTLAPSQDDSTQAPSQASQTDSLASQASNFDFSKFYLDAVMTEEDEEGMLDMGLLTLENLRNKVRQKQHQQRRLGKTQLTLGPDTAIGVSMYTLVLQQRKPAAVKVFAQNNAPLKTELTTLCRETGRELAPSDMDTYLEFGGDLVKITPQERNELARFSAPGLTLLGFKPRSAVPPSLNVSHGLLLRPDDNQVFGSSTLFAALIDSLHRKEEVAIVRSVPRANSTPRFAALFPQVEDVSKQQYGGLLLVPLPFADDIRTLDCPNNHVKPAASQEEAEERKSKVTLMKTLLKNIRAPAGFDFSKIVNPALQKFFAGLETVALDAADTDALDQLVDGLQPDVAAMSAPHIQEVCNRILALVDPLNVMEGTGMPGAKKPAAKRSAATGGDGSEPPAKRVKADVEALSDDVVKGKVQDGTLKKLTVDELKVWLRTKGISVTNKKKQDLLDDVDTWYNANASA